MNGVQGFLNVNICWDPAQKQQTKRFLQRRAHATYASITLGNHPDLDPVSRGHGLVLGVEHTQLC